jgi:ribosomal protein S18 acetylase RimI-like enzyme
MRFELTTALIDEILIAMENQNGEFLLDTERGILISAKDAEEREKGEGKTAPEDGRYLPLPDWNPAAGFRLMERFTAGLRGPLIRETLSSALNRGRGVFRAFKDAMTGYPETEKRWRRFKEHEMRREIIRWYNALRESWGLELIGGEPEETAGLVLEDFRFREAAAADLPSAEALHRAIGEAYRNGEHEEPPPNAALTRDIIAGTFAAMNPWVFPGDLCLAAETSGGEFAAYISAVLTVPSGLHVRCLEVKPEYQGLGLGESLLVKLLEKADAGNIPSVTIDLPAGTDRFARVLRRESFEPCVHRYCRNNP